MATTTVKRVRTCIGCGKRSDKVQLMRIVKSPAGDISYDPTGRLSGRGAYVCSPECLAKAMKGNKLQRALRAPLAREDADRIAGELAAAGE